MGHPQNITNKTFEEAAKAMSQSGEEAKKNTLELLKKHLKQAWLFTRHCGDKVWEIYFHPSGIIPFIGKF